MKKEGLKQGVIDFMVKAASDGKLLQGFYNVEDAKGLQGFAEDNGFAIDADDCDKLIRGRKDIRAAMGDRKCY